VAQSVDYATSHNERIDISLLSLERVELAVVERNALPRLVMLLPVRSENLLCSKSKSTLYEYSNVLCTTIILASRAVANILGY
jgi:hypothetical protein